MTAGSQAICAECGRAFVRRSGGRGRPARYCGQVCRRAAEFELRRAQGLLVRAQKAEQDSRMKVALEKQGYFKADAEKAAEFWAGEVERLRVDLRRLLASDMDSTSASPTYPESA